MNFDVRDPKFTARLETALIFLTKNPTVSVSYLTRRYNLEEGSLQLWLDTFNAGAKEVTLTRIGQVKAELGGITVRKVEPSPAAPPAEAPVAAPTVQAPPPTPAQLSITRPLPLVSSGAKIVTAMAQPVVAVSRGTRGPYKKRAVAPAPAAVPAGTAKEEPKQGLLETTLVASTQSLASLFEEQLNAKLASFRFEVEVRVVPAKGAKAS